VARIAKYFCYVSLALYCTADDDVAGGVFGGRGNHSAAVSPGHKQHIQIYVSHTVLLHIQYKYIPPGSGPAVLLSVSGCTNTKASAEKSLSHDLGTIQCILGGFSIPWTGRSSGDRSSWTTSFAVTAE
jgi:hypothetical protein